MSSPLLQFQGIDKSFGGVPVLKEVGFELGAGRILGLVGENGAGKSTLMNILGGNVPPAAGRMLLDGKPHAPQSPADAARSGVAFIHQELNLFPNLTIAENLFLTAFPKTAGLWIDQAELNRRATALLQQVGLELSPDTLVERLAVGERQLVEIARALSFNTRVIILDEPTTSLGRHEVEKLFALIEDLRRRGIAMIYISHNLEDVLRLCDDVVVLRDGAVVAAGASKGFSPDRLISLMVGRSLNQLYPPRTAQPSSETVFEVRNLSQPEVANRINFQVHRGETVGLFGLMGAGRSELARILFGLDSHASGDVWLEGRPLESGRLRQRIRRGVAFVTENRREEGLCLEASIADNLALVSLRKHASPVFGWLNLESLGRAVRNIRDAVRLTVAAPDRQLAGRLSGGNQQKLVVAKWLLGEPALLILDEPTRGIDVGARHEIYQLLNELTAANAGILMISSEIEELMGMCDRILVMRRGEIAGDFGRPEFNRERILRAALPESA